MFQHSESAKQKISESLLGNKRAAGNTNRRGKPGLKEESNPAWCGDSAGYIAKHNWVRRWFGKADHCENDSSHKASRFHWANISQEYLRVHTDWKQLCPKCHWRFDHPNGHVQPDETKKKISAGLKKAYSTGIR